MLCGQSQLFRTRFAKLFVSESSLLTAHMKMPNDSEVHSGAKRLSRALEEMGVTDLARLRQIALLRSHGLRSYAWEDLLNEALSRALAGTRVWPIDVPLLSFLAQTMRSIASEEWDRMGRENTFSESELSRDDQVFQIDAPDDRTPERHAIAINELQWIMALFNKDEDAVAVIDAWGRGLSPAEILRTLQIDEKRYAATQKRIRRRICTALEKERK